jgi:hypothetical protein
MCYIDGQKNKYSVSNECNRMLKYNTQKYILVFLLVSFLLTSHKYPICFPLPVLHISFDVGFLIVLGEERKLCSPSLCSFLQPPVTSSLYRSNIFLSTLFLNTFTYVTPLMSETKFSLVYNQRQNHGIMF